MAFEFGSNSTPEAVSLKIYLNSTMEISDVLAEFLECCIHSVLKSREIYPPLLFEQRYKYGITIWQCRHPEINSYIHRVISNSSNIINAVKRFMIIVRNSRNNIIDIISISYKFNFLDDAYKISASHFHHLEDEFRSFLLRLSLLDSMMTKFSEEFQWDIVIEVNDDLSDPNIANAIVSGDWYVDNRLLPTNANKDNSSSVVNIDMVEDDRDIISGTGINVLSPKITPIKSFRNEVMDVSAYAIVF